MKRALSLLALTVFVFALISTVFAPVAEARDAPIRWRAVSHSLPGTYRHTTLERFGELIYRASNGRMYVEVFGADMLFPVSDAFDHIANGVIEVGLIFSNFWVGRDPMFGVFSARPGSPLTRIEEGFFLEAQTFHIMERVYARHGVTYLGTISYSSPELLMMRTPIRTLEDFQGMNIRASGLGGVFYSRLGANVVNLPAGEIFIGLQTGVLDAAEWTEWRENEEMGLLEVTTYAWYPALHGGVNEDKSLIVNPAAWNALPEDLQAIFLLARDSIAWYSGWENPTESRMAKLKWLENHPENMITFSPEDEAAMREIANQIMLDQKQHGPDAVEFIEIYARVAWELGHVERAEALGFVPTEPRR